jgi:hypothetical protein
MYGIGRKKQRSNLSLNLPELDCFNSWKTHDQAGPIRQRQK